MTDELTYGKYGFFNSSGGDRLYDGSDFSRYLEGLITNGCLGDDGFKPVEIGGALGGNPPAITLQAGKAYYNGMWLHSELDFTFLMGSGPQVLPAKSHLLYFCFNTTDNEIAPGGTYGSSVGGPTAPKRSASIQWRVGLATTPPTIPDNTAGVYFMPLVLLADHQGNQPTIIEDRRSLAGAVAVNDTSPIGSGHLWFTDTAPTKYLLCQGQPLLKASYPDLAAVLRADTNPQWPHTDSNKFYLPDLQQKVPVGRLAGDTAFGTLAGRTVLGVETGKGGNKNLIVPSHTHFVSGDSQVYLPRADGKGYTDGGTIYSQAAGAVRSPAGIGADGMETSDVVAADHAHTAGLSPTNANLQPYLVVNYIIKALK